MAPPIPTRDLKPFWFILMYLTHNGGEYEDTRQKVGHHEQIFGVVLGRWRLANRRQCQRRPVERVDVLSRQCGICRSVQIVHPVIGAETECIAD